MNDVNIPKVVPTYLDNGPALVNREVFYLVEASLASQTPTEAEAEVLRIYIGKLRPQMNAHLGIVV